MRKKKFPIWCGFVSENGNYHSIRLQFLTAVAFRFVLASVMFRFVSFLFCIIMLSVHSAVQRK